MNVRWPAEWSEHLETVIVWPGRHVVWDPFLPQARREYAALVRSIAQHEPVRVVVPAVDPSRLTELDVPYTHANVNVLAVPTDDSWARDIAPLFVLDDAGHESAICFSFNAWGKKFTPHADDSAFGHRFAKALGINHRRHHLVLEGGSLDVDGRGTAIAVEHTILNDNRNPGWTRDAVELALLESLGIETVIWLPHGLIDDVDTDGHVDNVARFVGPGRVIAQVRGGSNADTDQLARNLRILQSARDSVGSPLEIIEMPWLPYRSASVGRPASYCNFYFVNGAVMLPVTGCVTDELAQRVVHDAVGLPVIPIEASVLAHGGGGVHCVAMPRFVPQTERIQQT